MAGLRGGRRRPGAGRAARRAGRRPGQIQRPVGHARPASRQARGARRSPARAGRRPGRSLQAASAPADPGRGAPAGVRPDRASARLPVARQCAASGRPERAGRTTTTRPSPAEVIKAYANMSDDVRAAAQSLLVSRRTWAARFLEAIERHDHRSPALSLAKWWRSCCSWATRASTRWRPGSSERSSRPPRPSFTPRSTGWPPSIRAGSGIPKPGKQIFDQQCAAVPYAVQHRGQGRARPHHVPPRRSRDDAPEYRQPQRRDPRGIYDRRSSRMTDGRVLSGIVVEQDKNVVVLRGSDGKDCGRWPAPTSTPCVPARLDHAGRTAEGLERPAGARPVCLSAEHTAADRLK